MSGAKYLRHRRRLVHKIRTAGLVIAHELDRRPNLDPTRARAVRRARLSTTGRRVLAVIPSTSPLSDGRLYDHRETARPPARLKAERRVASKRARASRKANRR